MIYQVHLRIEHRYRHVQAAKPRVEVAAEHCDGEVKQPEAKRSQPSCVEQVLAVITEVQGRPQYSGRGQIDQFPQSVERRPHARLRRHMCARRTWPLVRPSKGPVRLVMGRATRESDHDSGNAAARAMPRTTLWRNGTSMASPLAWRCVVTLCMGLILG